MSLRQFMSTAVVCTDFTTALPLNKALLLLFTMNKGCEMSAKTELHVHAKSTAT